MRGNRANFRLVEERMRHDIPTLNASFTVTSLIHKQEFYNPNPILKLASVYEGVAYASGIFMGEQVTGTAWNEQQIL